MKINTRKSVIFAALAVMILTAALVIACTSPISGLLEGVDEPTAPGTGRVRLSINTRNASRTILPTTLPSNIKYWVTFTHATDPYSVSVNGSGTINNIPANTYTGITVIVYTSASAVTTPAAAAAAAIGSGTHSSTVNITAGVTNDLSGTPIATTLYTPGSEGGDGTFAYNLDMRAISAGHLTAANFEIRPRPTGSTLGITPITITNYTTATLTGSKDDIPAGYYNVIFTLTDNAANTASFYQILHVYKNMTSTFTFAGFSDSLFPAGGGGTISITDPTAPDEIEYSLAVVSNASVTPSGGGFLVTVANGNTGTITLTITTSTGSPTITGWYYGSMTSFGTAAVLSSADTVVTLTINTSVAPFTGLPADIVTAVEFEWGSDYTSVPITIRITSP